MAEVLKLKKSNCKNCYKCIRHCPVKSIRFSAGQANIVGNECILCGQCFVVCPQNAKEIADDTEKVKVLLQGSDPVIASVAPSFIANYNNKDISILKEALKKLGFYDAEETANGAELVKKEYERILKRDKPELLISSCCHTVNLLIQKYYPTLLPYLAPVPSPMQANCISIKRRFPTAKTVFIGPCIAKKDEADHYEGIVDAVLTFEELQKMLSERAIVLGDNSTTGATITGCDGPKSRLFPTAGGILKTMDPAIDDYTYLSIDGTENCKDALEDIMQGGLRHCFIEMSACAGSCIGGPVMEKYHKSPIRNTQTVIHYAGKNDVVADMLPKENLVKEFHKIDKKYEQPEETQIAKILKQMGKTSPKQELNCGSCGYDTCRLKAIAIFQGKADLTMCLPFLKDKAESFSDTIIRNTPNGILVLNEDLEVQQINQAACELMNIRTATDVLGEPVVRILDPKPFLEIKTGGPSISKERFYMAEYKKYAEITIVHDRQYRNILCILRDITKEEHEIERKESIRKETMETADKVVEKQMRIVQEIASLLGETAAETKIALTKLKESISDE